MVIFEPELSVVIPTYNEKENLSILIPEIAQVLSQIQHEIVVVDDNSPDGSGQTVLDLAAAGYPVRLIKKKKREDIGAALRVGYDAATGRRIASMDADLSFETQDLIRFMKALDGGADLVVANRHERTELYEASKWPIKIKHSISYVGNFLLRFLSGIPIRDYSANFRMIRRDVWEKINTREKTNVILFEMIIKCWAQGYSVAQIPVTFRDRRFGLSKLRLGVEAPKFLIRSLGYLLYYSPRLFRRSFFKKDP